MESRRNPDAIRINGKPEDLVRLALKRLNVSYLTISSRLVRFERESLVCHARGGGGIYGLVKFFPITFYRRDILLSICVCRFYYVFCTFVQKTFCTFVPSIGNALC
jgi:hypothetical protein